MPHHLPDPYLPKPARILKVIEENSQIRTFVLAFTDPEVHAAFCYEPGQFVMVSVPHCGEAPISISSAQRATPGEIHLSVRRAGKLTSAMHSLAQGAIVALRGPYGRFFPMSDLSGKNLVFVGGGIGLAPLRAVIESCLVERKRYGTITILYGSRTPSDIAFRDDLARWEKKSGVKCLLTVDTPEPGWTGETGVVPRLLDQVSLDPSTSKALVCGPPLMIKFTLAALSAKGFGDHDIITTLERHMKCGVGLCRHCHLDHKLVCVDGPVFTKAELNTLHVMELP
ncbi:MAG: FAD/NAD(P)-binding protein [Thermodesulfobacteriota bacterium]